MKKREEVGKETCHNIFRLQISMNDWIIIFAIHSTVQICHSFGNIQCNLEFALLTDSNLSLTIFAKQCLIKILSFNEFKDKKWFLAMQMNSTKLHNGKMISRNRNFSDLGECCSSNYLHSVWMLHFAVGRKRREKRRSEEREKDP